MIAVERFESISKLIYELPKRKDNAIFQGKRSSEKTDDNEWSGTDSYEEAVRFALEGYTKPLDALKRGTIEAERKGTAPRRCKAINDIVGYTPNVPAAVIGLPQSMIRSDLEPKKSKVVSILYAPTQNCCTDSRTIEKAGVAVLSIINNLEKNGYRVALEVIFNFAEDGDETTAGMVKIKDWRQPLDLKKVAFPLCCSAMQRRIGFKWLETNKHLKNSDWRRGYGSSIHSSAKAERILKEAKLLDDKTFYINVELCQNHNFEPKEIAAACGIAKVR